MKEDMHRIPVEWFRYGEIVINDLSPVGNRAPINQTLTKSAEESAPPSHPEMIVIRSDFSYQSDLAEREPASRARSEKLFFSFSRSSSLVARKRLLSSVGRPRERLIGSNEQQVRELGYAHFDSRSSSLFSLYRRGFPPFYGRPSRRHRKAPS